MTFSIDNPRGVATTPLRKYVWEKPSGKQGLSNQKREKVHLKSKHFLHSTGKCDFQADGHEVHALFTTFWCHILCATFWLTLQ